MIKIFQCKACGRLHQGEEYPSACEECRATGNDNFTVLAEIPQEEPEQVEQEARDAGLVQLNMGELQTLITDTVNKAMAPMTQVDRRHAVFPGQDNPDDLNASKEERVVKFFRAVFAGETKEMQQLYAESLEKGDDKISRFERDLQKRTTLNETTAAQGGYLVPTEFVADVLMIAEQYGTARRDCLVVPMTRLSKNIHTLASGITVYWPAEGAAITQSEPTFGRTTLTAKKVAALVAQTDEFVEDSSVEIYSLISQLVGESIAEAEDNKLFQGTGSSPAITGILQKSGVNVVTMTSQSFADVVLKDLKGLPNALTKGSRTGGKFYLHYNTLYNISEERDSNNNYVWQNPQGAYPERIAGWPWEDSEEMPSDSDDAADTAFAAFGNLKKSTAFGDRKQLAVKVLTEGTVGTENLGEECKTALRFVERIDIAIFIATALARLKTAA